MSLSCGYDSREEDDELAMYGLRNEEEEEYDNSDEEREAIEQAMFMRIHYASAVDDGGKENESNEQEGPLTSDGQERALIPNEQESTLTSNNKSEYMIDKCSEKDKSILEDSNKIVISFTALPSPERIMEKESGNAESSKSDKDGKQKESQLRKSKVAAESVGKKNSPDLDDLNALITDKSDNDLFSKYCVQKRPAASSRGAHDNSVITLDTSTSDVMTLNSDECDTTINVSSSDSDSDVCNIVDKSKKSQQEVIDITDSPARRAPLTSLVLKIDRTSSSTPKSASAAGSERVNAKQRTWKGKDGLPTRSKRKGIFEISSDSIAEALQGNNPHVNTDTTTSGSINLKTRTKGDGSDSESDCMVIESMSEDEDMDFNFVIPLGMKKSKVNAVMTDGSTEKVIKTSFWVSQWCKRNIFQRGQSHFS